MRAWQLAVLALVVYAVHASVPGGGFHYDDTHAVVDNPHLRSLSQVPSYFTDPGRFSIDPARGMYRPVLLATYALGRALHGAAAAGYLRTNRLLHTANAVLVAAVAAALGAAAPAALLAGGLFGLHPAATEPAHYVSARSDSLMAAFFLLAVWLWLRGRHGGAGWRWGSVAATALALWTKATAVALAPSLLLLDVALAGAPAAAVPGQRREAFTVGARLRRHAPWWGVTVLYLVCSWSTRFLPGSLAAAPRGAEAQLLTQVKAILYYVRLCIWPVEGSVEPAFAESTVITTTVVAAALTAASLAVIAVGLWRRGMRRWLAVAGCGGLALVPVLLVPLNVLVNERRAYLPLAAFAILLAVALWRLAHRAGGAPVRTRGGLALGLLVVLAVLAHGRGAAWASDVSLWASAVRHGPDMPRAQLYLGDAHLRASEGRAPSASPSDAGGAMSPAAHRQAARAAYRRVLELQPRQRLLALQALNGLALLDLDAGDLDAAETRLQRALAEHPAYVDALVNLGKVDYTRALASRGRDRGALERATEHFRRAVALAPQRFEAHLNLGACYHLTGDLGRAQAEYEAAAALAPEDGTVALNLGHLYRQRAEASTGAARAAWLERAGRAYGRALQRLRASQAEAARRGQQAVAAERRGEVP